MGPESVLGPLPDGMPATMYLAFLYEQDREIRKRNKEARKARKR